MSALSAKTFFARLYRRLGFVTGLGALSAALACAPIIRPAPFHGARDQVTGATLIGPFDGQILDARTGEPLPDAIVVGVWSYDRGDGFIGPYGSESIVVETDQAGRYRIGEAPQRVRGTSVRLVSFHLLVYKRGYAGYRSDQLLSGGPRRDFTARHNQIRLDKWSDRESHAEHLLFLSPSRDIAKASAWERHLANLALYRHLMGEDETGVPPSLSESGGASSSEEKKGNSPASLRLDATALLSPEDVITRTGFDGELEVLELGDLERTHFYHGVHLKARDRPESYDVAYRVFKKRPGGVQGLVELMNQTIPGVQVSAEVTPETWVYSGDDSLRAVGFIDREQEVGIILSCGVEQCVDLDSAIILGKLLHSRIDRLRQISADQAAAPKPAEADEQSDEKAEAETREEHTQEAPAPAERADEKRAGDSTPPTAPKPKGETP